MSRNVVLTDFDGEQILPITTAENVFVSEGVTLKQIIDRMASGGQITIGLSHTPINTDIKIANYMVIEEG